MVATYILIICGSAFLAALAGVRLWRRISPLFGNRDGQMGLCIMVPAIAFLIVAAAPPAVLFFATATMAMFLLMPDGMARPLTRGLWVALVATVPLMYLHGPDDALIAKIASLSPSVASAMMILLYVVPIVFMSALLVMAPRLAMPLKPFALALIASCLPLILAPLIAPNAGGVAIDAAIVASAALGAVIMVQRQYPTGIAAHMGAVVVVGYMQITAIWHGGWIAAILSIVIWGLGIVRVVMQRAAQERARLAEILPHA